MGDGALFRLLEKCSKLLVAAEVKRKSVTIRIVNVAKMVNDRGKSLALAVLEVRWLPCPEVEDDAAASGC